MILPKVGFQRFSIWMRFELTNQLVDPLLCVYGLLVQLKSVAVLEFDDRFHCNRSLRACWNGRWMLSLQCLLYPFILHAKPVSVQLFAVSEEVRTFCYTDYHQFLNTRCSEVYFTILFVDCNSGLRHVVIPLLV